MNCKEFARQSETWMEGRPDAPARAHAAECERCRAYVEDLDAIRLLAPQLATMDVAPPERLWHEIHAQTLQEGLIRYDCEEFLRQSEEWLEGRPSVPARTHAAECERCRDYVEDLDSIRLLAPQLAIMDVAPPERLWHAIHAQALQEGLVRYDCEEFLRQSEEWMEGRRSAQARAHAMECERCRDYVEDLDSIRLLAPQLTALDTAPPERLWQSIHARMIQEGLVRRAGRPRRLSAWVPTLARPLAAAVAALALAALTFTLTSRPPVPSTPPAGRAWLSADQTDLASVDTELNHVERGTIGSFRAADPQVAETLQQNLMIVNRQIARCEKTLEEAPSDESTRDYLYDAYQQKADLLNLMAEQNAGVTE